MPGLYFGQPYTFMSHLNLKPNHSGAGKHDPAVFTVRFQSYLLSYVPHISLPSNGYSYVIKPFSVWRRVMLLSQLDIIAGNELVVGARTAEWNSLFKYTQRFLVVQQH